MHRYVLFAGYDVPLGGWEDFKGFYPTPEDALRNAALYDWAHVLDTVILQIVKYK